jgi:hypothetical protein
MNTILGIRWCLSGQRSVLDTNIAVSARLFAHGRPATIRLAWQANMFATLVSAATTEELIRVLGYAKFKLSSADRDELLADYLPYCTTAIIPRKAPKIPSSPPMHSFPSWRNSSGLNERGPRSANYFSGLLLPKRCLAESSGISYKTLDEFEFTEP